MLRLPRPTTCHAHTSRTLWCNTARYTQSLMNKVRARQSSAYAIAKGTAVPTSTFSACPPAKHQAADGQSCRKLWHTCTQSTSVTQRPGLAQ